MHFDRLSGQSLVIVTESFTMSFAWSSCRPTEEHVGRMWLVVSGIASIGQENEPALS